MVSRVRRRESTTSTTVPLRQCLLREKGKIAVGRAEAIFVLRISRMAQGSVQRWQLSPEFALTGASIYSAALQNNPKNRPNAYRRLHGYGDGDGGAT